MELVERWWRDRPAVSGGPIAAVTADLSRWIAAGESLAADLAGAGRAEGHGNTLRAQLRGLLRSARGEIYARYAPEVYAHVTSELTLQLRLEELVAAVQATFADLLPRRTELAAEAAQGIPCKEGERDVAQFLSHVLAEPRTGAHLLSAMRRPLPTSQDALAEFRRAGWLNLGSVQVSRRGQTAYVTLCNTRSLNAEDPDLLAALECAIDVALLDPTIRAGVLRGGVMVHPKYSGRRVFCSGLDLKLLARGGIGIFYFVGRELGLMSKLYRGLAGASRVKVPWVALVETHAIGGGLQLLLVMERVIAERGAMLSLPANNEGFLPGVAGLRLPKRVGASAARGLLEEGKSVLAQSRIGRMLCDRVVATSRVEGAGARMAEHLAQWSISERRECHRARLRTEPEDEFRRFMAWFALEQADRMSSPVVAANLERWRIGRHATAI